MSLYFTRFPIIVAALIAVAPGVAPAAEHVVKMLNDNGKGEFMVFEPSFIEAAPGDTVKFVAVDKFHNAETLPEVWPEGAETFKGEISQDVTLKIDKPGVYGIKCLPHYPIGMVALVVAGDPVNANQVKTFKGPTPQVDERFAKLAEKVPQ